MQEPDHHIGDLHAGVINVVLNFNGVTRGAQQAHESIAQHGIAQVADVRGLIGIDGGVLDDSFAALGDLHGHLSGGERCEEGRAIKEGVDIAAAGHFPAGHAFDRTYFRDDLLRDLPRRTLQSLGEFKAHWRSHLAHFDFGRLAGDDGDLRAVLLLDESAQRFAHPRFEDVIHVAPYR